LQTTALFVELIVIGIGGAFWFSLIALTVFGYTWIPLEHATSLPALIPALALVYLLGILIDRVADLAFSLPTNHMLHRVFQSREAYERARTLVYDSEALRNLAVYALSRMRICRGSVLNSLLGVMSLNAFLWTTLPDQAPRLKLALFGTVTLLLIAGTALYSWRELSVTYYERVAQQAHILAEQQNSKPG